jgi:hypothetical protein
MLRLEQMIKPTIGLLTNIGVAHKAGFKSKEEKIYEKLELFKNVETMIFPNSYLENIQLPYRPRKFSWGLDEGFLWRCIPSNRLTTDLLWSRSIIPVAPLLLKYRLWIKEMLRMHKLCSGDATFWL